MAVFAMVFGNAFGVSPLIVNNAWIAAENPYWHFLGLSFSPCGAAPLVDPVCFLSHHVLLQEPPRCLASPRGASQFLKLMLSPP